MPKKQRKRRPQASALPVVQPQVAGVDVGSRSHWVCAPPHHDGSPKVRVFDTTTPDLCELVAWLQTEDVRSVAMESTGVYWIPLYELLESHGFEVVLVNARMFKSVPGRKTDMQDCQWIQQLHSCGLLSGSFRPHESICAVRALQRQSASFVQQRSRAVQWMQKALDQMNVQVHHAVTDLMGATGQAILRAIVDGERDPSKLAALRDHRCKKSEQQIAKHLTGTWRDEHLFNLKMALRHYDEMQALIEAYDGEIKEHLERMTPPDRHDTSPPPHPNATKERAIRKRAEQPMRDKLYRLTGVDLLRIDGVSTGVAQVVISEAGFDLRAFPTEKHFVSWLRLSPQRPVSGGKVLKKRAKGTGSSRIAAVLRMAASSLRRSRTALGAAFRRIARRKDYATAVFATARKLAQLIYRTLRFGQQYLDIGERAYEERYHQARIAGLRSSAKSLGYHIVKDEPAPQVSA